MSKPMLVTLPFVILLLDYWPLQRLGKSPAPAAFPKAASWRILALEKVPFLLLAALSCCVTLWAQSKGGALVPSQ